MINIAIVDDEITFQEAMKEHLSNFTKENHIDFNVSYFCNGEDFIKSYDKKYQIVFMDIQMGQMDGIETSKKLREIDKDIIIIFLTNLAQYAIKGYEVDALDFVVKPINYYVLSMKLNRAISKIKNEETTYRISFSYQNNKYYLETNTIKYIEVTGHKIVFYTTNGDYCTYELSLTKLEKLFEEKKIPYFCRCNQYLLVNLNYVNSLSGFRLVIDGKELMISRTRKKELVERLSQFYSQGKKN